MFRCGVLRGALLLFYGRPVFGAKGFKFTMLDEWSPTALLVHAAALTYVIGFLVRDQLILRGLLQVGSVFYILYYYLEPATPLWDAIAWTAVMFAANAWTISRILADRRTGRFDDDDLIVFSAIQGIAPGDFRRLMAKAAKDTAHVEIGLTREGDVPRNLWFLISGKAVVDKKGFARAIPGPMFIGEIAYLLKQPASATVTLEAGSRYVRWPVEDLYALVAKSETLGNALDAAFNRDLAAKVAAS